MSTQKNAVVQGEHYRFTVLTPCLIRMEYSKKDCFTDARTQMVVDRDFPVPEFDVVKRENELIIDTGKVRILYERGEFSGYTLRAELGAQPGMNNSIWHYGDKSRNLKGTTRTLDRADGEVELQDGLFSMDGWAVISDKGSMLLGEDGWIKMREDREAEDFYFFAYGKDYLGCLKDYYKLTGATPILPKFAMGNWWSRYYKYTEKSYLELMDRFEKEEIPFTVGVIDMDWHITQVDPKYGSGWTGYTWNREFFPDPKRFTDNLHERGMKVTLNDHPADGVRAFEELYPEFAAYMGVDQEKEEPVRMDFTNRKLVEGFFHYVYEKLEKRDGVDFWWIDWQQGTRTGIPGLDPLWMLNHYHYLHSKEKNGQGLIFSRYAGPGSHRYPVGFSGDSIITWESLDFQPYFTVTASNIGYGWWSHDIGGHMRGYKNDELALRWLQFGVFSPILRLHSSCSEFNGKEPWRYRKDVELVMDRFLRLRHQMIPYLHSMNRRASVEGIPLMQPMYYQNPLDWSAYMVRNEYYFGESLIVCPITQPMAGGSCQGKASVWLPEGNWVDLFTGMVYHGNRMMEMYRPMDSIPVLGKAGKVLILDARITGNAIDNPENMEVIVFAGADGSFRLYEETEEHNWCSTEFTYQWGEDATFTIVPEKEDGMPKERAYKVSFLGTAAGMSAEWKHEDGTVTALTVEYDAKRQCTTVEIPMQAYGEKVEVLTHHTVLGDNNEKERIFDALNRAEISFDTKESLFYQINDKLGKRSNACLLDQLLMLDADENILGMIKEVLLSLE